MPRHTILMIAFSLFAIPPSVWAQEDDLANTQASEPTVNPEITDEGDERLIMDRPGYDPSVPLYENVNPAWSLGLRAAFNKFPTKSAIGNSYQVIGEYILPFYKAGVFSVGGHIGVLPIRVPNSEVPVSNVNGIAGFQARYQLKLWKQQWLVPTLTWEFDFYWIQARAGDTGKMTNHSNGMGYGMFFLLSPLDSTTARDGYQSLGIVRSYFTVEAQPLNLTTNVFSIKGSVWYFGIRMEFE